MTNLEIKLFLKKITYWEGRQLRRYNKYNVI